MEQMRVGAMAFSKSARNKATVTTLKDVTSAVAYLLLQKEIAPACPVPLLFPESMQRVQKAFSGST